MRAFVFIDDSGSHTVYDNPDAHLDMIAKWSLPKGAWVVSADLEVINVSDPPVVAVFNCVLFSDYPSEPCHGRIRLPAQERAQTRFTLTMGVDARGSSHVMIDCNTFGGAVNISDYVISAIEVGELVVRKVGELGHAAGSSTPLVGIKSYPPLYVSTDDSTEAPGFVAAPPLYVKMGGDD
jgi:hypothetical protein